MNKQLLSISLSNYCVRIVSGVRRKSAFVAYKSYVFPLPTELQGDNNTGEKSAAPLGAFIGSMLKANGVKLRRAMFSVSASKTVAKNVTLPKMNHRRLDEAVMLNAAEWFPVDLSQYRIVYSAANTEADGSFRLQVYAIPKNLVDNYTKIASAAGLLLDSIDYAPNSRNNLYRSLNPNGTVVYAHVEDSTTSVVVLRDGVEQFFRTLLFGVSDLVTEYRDQHSALSQQDNRDATSMSYFDAALALTEKPGSDVLSETNASQLLSRVASGIGHSVRYYIGNSGGGTVDAVILDGPYRKMWRLRESVAEEVSCPVTVLAPRSDIHLRDFPSFVTALGAPIAPLNILASHNSKEIRRQRALEKKIKAQHSSSAAKSVLVFTLLACVGIDAFVRFDAAEALRQRNRALSERNALLYVQAAYDESVQFGEYLAAAGLVDVVSAEPNVDLKAVFEELETKLPDVTILEFISCTAEGITFNFKVPDIDDAARVIMLLRTFESFAEVDVRGLTSEDDTFSVPGVTFTANCLYISADAGGQDVINNEDMLEQDAEAAQEGELR